MSANSANTGSWLSAHGKLWYDDRWYRIAWIIWPQAVGMLLFVSLWLFHPAGQGGQGFLPWARPMVETRKYPPAPVKEPVAPPLAEQPVDVLAPCTSGDFAQNIQACTTLLASGTLRGSNLAYAYYHRGWAYYSTKQYQPAMNDYDRAIANASGVPDFYNERGILWMDVGNNERAMQDFDQAILLKSDYALGYLNRGVALRNLKRPNEALVALATAIERDPKLTLAYENRAFLNEDRSNWRAVYDDALKVIELAPDDRMGYELRGHAYLEVGQYQAAITDFTRAISIDTNAIYDYRMRGRAYYSLNQFDNATADFGAALRIDAQDSETISFINDLRRRQRDR
jgi:tetratricopeptide (TPR) repeat protein